MAKKSFPMENARASIKRLMEGRRERAKPLAGELGLGETAIRDIFLPSRKSISMPTLKAIADHYQVTVEDILAGTADARPGGPNVSPLPAYITVESISHLLDGVLSFVQSGPDPSYDAESLAHGICAGLEVLAENPAKIDNAGYLDGAVAAGLRAVRNYRLRRDRAA